MKKIVKNYLYNMSYQVLVMFLPIVTTPYISRVLKPEGVGVYNYAYSIVSLIIMLSQLGTNLYGQREIAFVQNDPIKKSIVFYELVQIRVLTTLLSVPFFLWVVKCNKDNTVILLYMMIYFLSNVFDIAWFFQGLEEFKKIAIRNMVVKISGVCLIFLFVHKQSDLSLYVLILAITQLLGNMSLWVGIDKKIVCVSSSSMHLKSHVKPILALFLPTAAMYAYVYMDKIILGILSDSVQVGYYSQTERLVKLILTIITSLGAVLLPHISNKIKQNRLVDVQTDIKVATAFVAYIGIPMVVGMILVSSRFIPLFLGDEFVDCVDLFSILSILVFIIGLASVVGQAVLIPMKKQMIYSISIFSGAILNLLINLLLIPHFAALGACIGTVVAEFTVTTVQLVFVYKLLHLKFLDVFTEIWKCLPATLVMCGVGIMLDRFMGEGVLNLIIIILCCVSIYLGMLIMLKDSYLIRIVNAKGEK